MLFMLRDLIDMVSPPSRIFFAMVINYNDKFVKVDGWATMSVACLLQQLARKQSFLYDDVVERAVTTEN